MDHIQAYLSIPWPYVKDFASIRWSSSEDALVYEDGDTFILRQALAHFIDGFGVSRNLIHFGYILHLLDIFLKEKTHRPQICTTLRQLMKQPGVSYRNAGLLAAYLVPKLSTTASSTLATEVFGTLTNSLRRIFDIPGMSRDLYDLPTQTPLEFENLVNYRLKVLSEHDLRHWLRTGESPQSSEPRLPALPASAWEENLLGTDRLRGVAPFLMPLLSAISLPPRHLASHDIPLGGYADVSNRGRIDALLPSQFALDADDFIRRFAEQELLYFRREDPVTLPEADLLIILDQGVRTWGSIRLRLTAAAVALIVQAQSHGRRIYIATSNTYQHLREISSIPPSELTEMLEASDLTSHPSVVCSMMAELTAEHTYDVIQLTHPRSLVEKAVIQANQSLGPTSRLFALTIDQGSNATWGQIKDGQLTKAQRFQIQAVQRLVPRTDDKLPHFTRQIAWAGDVEPFASPFKVPLRYKVITLDFDTEDRWMFVLDSSGRITAYGLDQPEQVCILPRCNHKLHGLVLFEGLVSVPDGIVAHARLEGGAVLVAHYCMSSQTVQCTTSLEVSHSYTGNNDAAISASSTVPMTSDDLLKAFSLGYYYPDGHSVVITDKEGDQFLFYQLRVNSVQLAKNRVHFAAMADYYFGKEMQCLRRPEVWRTNRFLHEPHTGRIILNDFDSVSLNLIPVSDGKPVHMQETLQEYQKGGNTLCLLMKRPKVHSNQLYIYQLPRLHRIAEWRNVSYFKLSPSGRYLGRKVHDFCVHVEDLHNNNQFVISTRSSNKIRIRQMVAGHRWLVVQYGKRNSFLIDWRTDTLRCQNKQLPPIDTAQMPHTSTPVELVGSSYSKDLKGMRCQLTYPHRIIGDELGQVWFYDLSDNLVCVFLIDQTDIAGWMPDGTVFGPARLTGADSTPDAMDYFADALLAGAGRHS